MGGWLLLASLLSGSVVAELPASTPTLDAVSATAALPTLVPSLDGTIVAWLPERGSCCWKRIAPADFELHDFSLAHNFGSPIVSYDPSHDVPTEQNIPSAPVCKVRAPAAHV